MLWQSVKLSRGPFGTLTLLFNSRFISFCQCTCCMIIRFSVNLCSYFFASSCGTFQSRIPLCPSESLASWVGNTSVAYHAYTDWEYITFIDCLGQVHEILSEGLFSPRLPEPATYLSSAVRVARRASVFASVILFHVPSNWSSQVLQDVSSFPVESYGFVQEIW